MALTLPTDNELPLFEDLERHYRTIKPAVQGIYDMLATVQRLWLFGGVDQILAATPADQMPLGQGALTVTEWLEVQRLFKALSEWIVTPVTLSTDPEGATPGPIPLAVISRRPSAPVQVQGHIAPPPVLPTPHIPTGEGE
jgi:hypothetical protein